MLNILRPNTCFKAALIQDLQSLGVSPENSGWYVNQHSVPVFSNTGDQNNDLFRNYSTHLNHSESWTNWAIFKEVTGYDPLYYFFRENHQTQLQLIADWIKHSPVSPITQYLMYKFRQRYGASALTKKQLQEEFNIPQLKLKYEYLSTGQRVLVTARWNVYSVGPAFYNNFYEGGTTPVTNTREAPCSILEYNARTTDYLPTPDVKKKRLFGIELELEGINSAKLARIHAVLKEHCIFKRDGSLHEGVEIVSRPHTMDEHRKMFKQFFEANHGLRAESNCGIHIHTEKRGLSFLTLGRLVALLNKKENQGAIIKIAGRNSTNYARLEESHNLLSPWYSRDQGSREELKRVPSWTKYSALNLRPENTIEFRIFKSTTDFEEFSRFLDFAEASTDYASNFGTTKTNTMAEFLDIKNFFQYVKERATAYPALAKFIRKELA